MSPEAAALLSRVADAVYWMARYVERAENVARSIEVNLHLQYDLPLGRADEWQPLIDTSGDDELFLRLYRDAGEASAIRFLAFDERNPNSIYSCLRTARENARSIRDTISSEMWEQVNRMYLDLWVQQAKPQHESLHEIMRGIRLSGHMFQGITDATMSHNEAWHFHNMGRMMERADKTSRILDVKYFVLLPSNSVVGTPYDDLHWAAMLKSVSGFEMYRKTYGRISPGDIVDFLLMSREFPRAIRHCVDSAEESLHAITGVPAGSCEFPSELRMAELNAELDSGDAATVVRNGLHQYLDGIQSRLNEVDADLVRDFFFGGPTEDTTPPHFR